MRSALQGSTQRVKVAPPKPSALSPAVAAAPISGNAGVAGDHAACGGKDLTGFDTGAQGIATFLQPGGATAGGAAAVALSRFRFPPPLEAVEEEISAEEGLITAEGGQGADVEAGLDAAAGLAPLPPRAAAALGAQAAAPERATGLSIARVGIVLEQASLLSE